MMKPEAPRAFHACACSECQRHVDGATARAHRDINRLIASLDERDRRLFVGFLARQDGSGGIRPLVRITGLSRNTIRRGLREWEQLTSEAPRRIRRPGGGRKRVEKRGSAS
jgi:hypothetical protein